MGKVGKFLKDAFIFGAPAAGTAYLNDRNARQRDKEYLEAMKAQAEAQASNPPQKAAPQERQQTQAERQEQEAWEQSLQPASAPPSKSEKRASWIGWAVLAFIGFGVVSCFNAVSNAPDNSDSASQDAAVSHSAPASHRASYLSRMIDPKGKDCYVNYGSDAVHCPGKEKQQRR